MDEKTTKVCTKCKQELSLADFYRLKKGVLGRRPDCKDCGNLVRRRWYYAGGIEGVRERGRRYKYVSYRSPEERKKERARDAVAYAIKNGELTRLPCEVCSNPLVQAHHTDYDKPLQVTWLCDEHHRNEHRRLRSLV